MTPVKLDPTASRYRVKHSTTEPLRTPWRTDEAISYHFEPKVLLYFKVNFISKYLSCKKDGT